MPLNRSRFRSSRSGPDATVVRWYGQRVLLERRDPFEIEIAAVQFFDIVAAHGKPEWDRLLVFRCVDCDERELRIVVSGKQEQSKTLVSLPMVEEEERSAPDMAAAAPDTKELSNQGDGRAPGSIVEIIPTKRSKQ